MYSTIRIIGGKWRGRKVSVPHEKDLRPTLDRVRETLFNWLAPYIPHSRCLDAFAGSGILGLEALSRGADHVTFVDANATCTQGIAQTPFLESGTYALHTQSVLTLTTGGPFDIVFLDPPFKGDLLLPTSEHLESQGLLAKKAWIYIETPTGRSLEGLPAHWACIKSKKTKTLQYQLYRLTH